MRPITDHHSLVVLEPHGDDLGGFVLLRGDKTKMATLRVDPEFIRTIVGAQLVYQKVSVVGAYSGAEMQALFGVWEQQESRLLPKNS